jgi:hypothetical protein
MTSLTFTDLSRCDKLDPVASQSVRGGNACFTRENPSSCHGGKPPVFIPHRWNGCPPAHIGCGPVLVPLGCAHPEPLRVVLL